MSEDIDAGPHATPDQVRAALKRRDAARAANEGRTAEPQERHAPDAATTAKRAAKKS